MPTADRFAQPLPQPAYVPPTSPVTVGQKTLPTLAYEEWRGVQGVILKDVNRWLAAQPQDKVFLPALPNERSAHSEAAVSTQLAGQALDVVQKALNRAGLGVDWRQEPQKSSGGQVASSRAGDGDVTYDLPAQALEVDGGGLLRKPDFEMVQGGQCKTFLEVKVP